VIIPDINLLVYAYNASAPDHDAARTWWEAAMSGSRPVGLPWVVLLGYLRLITGRNVLAEPFSAEEAVGHLRSWLARPQTIIVGPGPRHLDLVEDLMRAANASGQLTTDIHLAALAIEHQAELCSNDTDFARFPGLRWADPLG
jgi:toxin-antitoxin system PIN domain toxin